MIIFELFKTNYFDNLVYVNCTYIANKQFIKITFVDAYLTVRSVDQFKFTKTFNKKISKFDR